MPTGYTAIIEERADLTFREFALRCARAMGACIMQRDDSIDELPKAPEPSTFYAEQKVAAEAKLRELRSTSKACARALWEADCKRIETQNAESVAKAKETGRRYARMRAMVEAWKPPTKDHEGLKCFMLEQIDACKSDWTPYLMASAPSSEEWLAKQIEAAEWSLKYSTEHAADEVARANERKAWIDDLYASVSV